MNSYDETTYFRYRRKIDGSLEQIDIARCNDRLVPRFAPSIIKEACCSWCRCPGSLLVLTAHGSDALCSFCVALAETADRMRMKEH